MFIIGAIKDSLLYMKKSKKVKKGFDAKKFDNKKKKVFGMK